MREKEDGKRQGVISHIAEWSYPFNVNVKVVGSRRDAAQVSFAETVIFVCHSPPRCKHE